MVEAGRSRFRQLAHIGLAQENPGVGKLLDQLSPKIKKDREDQSPSKPVEFGEPLGEGELADLSHIQRHPSGAYLIPD
jgi:hypothetical protein